MTIIDILLTTDVITWLNDCDGSLLLAVNGSHNTYWDTFMWMVSGKLEWIPLYVAIVYVLFRNFTLKTALACLVAFAILFALTDAMLSQLIRPAVARLRPSNPDNPISEMVHVVNNYRGGRYGFPSAHASNAWGLTFYVIYLLRHRLLSIFMVGWACLLCYSRMYMGVHYPGDLLTGALLAFICSSAVYFILRKTTDIQPPKENMHEAYVPVIVGLALITIFLVVPLFS